MYSAYSISRQKALLLQKTLRIVHRQHLRQREFEKLNPGDGDQNDQRRRLGIFHQLRHRPGEHVDETNHDRNGKSCVFGHVRPERNVFARHGDLRERLALLVMA